MDVHCVLNCGQHLEATGRGANASGGYFDAAFCNAMFGNVFDQEATLGNLGDMLTKGGRVVIRSASIHYNTLMQVIPYCNCRDADLPSAHLMTVSHRYIHSRYLMCVFNAATRWARRLWTSCVPAPLPWCCMTCPRLDKPSTGWQYTPTSR